MAKPVTPSTPTYPPLTNPLLDLGLKPIFKEKSFFFNTENPPYHWKTSSSDIKQVKDLMAQAEKGIQDGDKVKAYGHYIETLPYLNFSVQDSKRLLLKVVCYFKIGHLISENSGDYSSFNEASCQVLRKLDKKLSGVERNDPNFMASLGAVYVNIGRDNRDIKFYELAKTAFLEAECLLKKHPLAEDTLKHKIFLGLGLTYIYLTIMEIGAGQKKGHRHLEYLKKSISYLERASILHSSSDIEYAQTFAYSFTSLILEEGSFFKISEKEKDFVQKQSDDHLNKALKIATSIHYKTSDIFALLASIKYKKALDHTKVDYYGGYQAFLHFSEAFTTLGTKDNSLILGMSDALRQLAWVCPIEVFQCLAEKHLKEATEIADNKFIAETNLLIFKIQKILLKMCLSNELQKDLKDLIENVTELKSILQDFPEDSVSCCIHDRLEDSVEHIEDEFLPYVMYFNQKQLTKSAMEIGNKIDVIYISPLFKFMLFERLRFFNLALDLDINLI